MKRRVFLGLPVILGILFYIWYIFHASDNVAYSDYIRLVNSYLPDVTNPAKFFVPDILTRVPITYLGRIINVKLFGYNTYFDMILGVLSLGAGAAVLALYAERNRSVGYLSFLLIQFVYFSLNNGNDDEWDRLGLHSVDLRIFIPFCSPRPCSGDPVPEYV